MAIRRWLRHALATPRSLNRAYPEAALVRIRDAIASAESAHSGEVRFAIEARLPWSYLRRKATARERAEMVFSKLRVWDTEYNNGVLIYVLLADQGIEIVADRALNRVSPAEWQAIVKNMRARFRAGEFEAGAVAGVSAIGALLTHHFPLGAGDRNADELPNAPTVL
jgi:uncharacterized membrane protein